MVALEFKNGHFEVTGWLLLEIMTKIRAMESFKSILASADHVRDSQTIK